MIYFEIIAKWAELIGILIPLVILIFYKPKGKEIRPLVIYVLLAAIPNLLIVLISTSSDKLTFLSKNNHIYYNIHSIIKVVFFGWYLSGFKELKSSLIIKFTLFAYLIFCVINYLFLDSIFIISNWMLNVENILLLLFCISFFLSTIIDSSDTIWMAKPVFFVCAGINFYAAISFFIFLFFNYFNVYEKGKQEFGGFIINIFAYSYLILCGIIAWAIWKSSIRKTNLLNNE